MIDIDIMANTVPGDDQLNGMAASVIRSQYTHDQELKIHRRVLANPSDPTAKANFDAYNAYIESVSAALTVAKTTAATLRAVIDYEAAERLIKYVQGLQISPPLGTPLQSSIDSANEVVRNASPDVLAMAAQRASNRI